MSYSGIVVCTRPDRLADLALSLSDLPGVQVHQRDTATGRLVVTLEAGSVDDEIRGLRQIQSFPGVVSADLVYHCLPEGSVPTQTELPSPSGGTHRGET